jgi:glutamine synthetase
MVLNLRISAITAGPQPVDLHPIEDDMTESSNAAATWRGDTDKLLAAGVKYGLAAFVDLHGRIKGKCVPIAHLSQMMAGSELFTGAALDGVPQDISDNEVAAMPDAARALQMPWRRDIAWFPSDLHLNGAPFGADSRGILKRQLAKAAEQGWKFQTGVEPEFYILKENGGGRAVPTFDQDTLDKPCYDVPSLLGAFPYVEEIVAAMNELGWDVYSFDHEDGNGQFEIDFNYADALTNADRITFLKLMIGEIARKHGYYASWMPKPFADRTGSGAHLNMSLASLETGENLFEDKADPLGLSKLGYQFAAGVLRHAPAITAVIAPTVNSYKRLVKRGAMSGSTWAPVFACYGNNNRTNMLRVPMGGGRIECRAADSSMNTYLASALVLAAGLEGIREGLDPGPPRRDNLYNLSEADRAAQGVNYLPRTLGEALAAFEADPLAKAVFGEGMFESFLAYKTSEWEAYQSHVSEWETQRYLRFF